MKPASNNARRAQPLLGTFVEIAAAGVVNTDIDAAIDAAFRVVDKVHRLMSFHEPTSDVGRLNRLAPIHPVEIDPWTYQVIETSLYIHRRSAGAFDVAIAPFMQALGLLPRFPTDPPRPSPRCRNSAAIELLPGCRIRFHGSDIGIDLGGIAKGFAVDRAVEVLRASGMTRGLVNAGGDIAAFGSDAEVVDVRDPRDPRALMCRVGIRNEALATTGGHLDPFRGFQSGELPIVEPRAGRAAASIIGATVRAPSCMIADALTKIVVIAGERTAAVLKHFGASAIFVSANGTLHATNDWREDSGLAG
jgi:FAD:protein FMN transferase